MGGAMGTKLSNGGNTMHLSLIATAAVLVTAAPASAALFDVPVPRNAYITVAGADFAWASPCSPAGCNFLAQEPLDLSYQSTQGWRVATWAEILAAGVTASSFVFPGANVPAGGADPVTGTIFVGSAPGDAACAAAYFTPAVFNQCNWGDATAGAIWGNPAWTGAPNVETWVIRDTVVTPAPAALALFGLGVAGIAGLRRRCATR
jgi:hypothetical protein